MLATILKSPVATETTIAIVEAFANLRAINRIIKQLPYIEDEKKQISLVKRVGDAIMEIFDTDVLEITGKETKAEFNVPFIKVTHTIKREKRKD
jgi:hypothetical protein